MPRIDCDRDIVTLINVFTVAPERQGELVELLEQATERVMCERPGYLSASIHRGLDGSSVANYAQWRSRADFEAMLADPQAREHMRSAAELAGFEPHLYEVAFSHERR